MNKKYIIGVAIVLLTIAALFLIDQKQAAAPGEQDLTATTTESVLDTTKTTTGAKTVAPTLTKTGAYLVSYLNGGFSPKTLTIKRGKSVHFVNSSNKAMSITAVDQTSQIYRELNQEQSVGRGGAYDFTFLTPGTWVYTNRNNRLDVGTIIVQ